MQPLRSDPVLRELIEEHGVLELEPAADPFKRLVVSIVNQQLSTASARAIRERLFDRFAIAPKPLLNADEDELAAVGLSRQKRTYIRNAATAFIEGDITNETFTDMSDQEVIDELTTVSGIGVWTAKMFLIFSLGREDIFPVEDLGIRNGIQELYGDRSTEEMVTLAERWRPKRSIAALYIWRAYEDTTTAKS